MRDARSLDRFCLQEISFFGLFARLDALECQQALLGDAGLFDRLACIDLGVVDRPIALDFQAAGLPVRGYARRRHGLFLHDPQLLGRFPLSDFGFANGEVAGNFAFARGLLELDPGFGHGLFLCDACAFHVFAGGDAFGIDGLLTLDLL